MGARLRLLLLLSCITFLPAHAGEDQDPPPLLIWCPALSCRDAVYAGAPFSGTYQTDLVVVGTRRKVDDDRYEITVEETLFGVPQSPVLELDRGPEGRFIFTFKASNYGRGRLSYTSHLCGGALPVTPANLAGVRALSKARLMTMALSATAIFTGRTAEPPPKNDRHERRGRSVTVTEVLHGSVVQKGETVRVRLPRFWAAVYDPATDVGESVYLVGGHEGASFPRATAKPTGPLRDRRLLPVRRVLPGELADKIRPILPVRDSLPLVELRYETLLVREVVFTGTVAEALLILESDCYGAAHLARRSLVRHHGESRELVLVAIRERLFDLEVREPDRYRTLRRLIRTLSDIETRDPQGDLEELIGDWLAFLEADPPPAPGLPPPPPRGFKGKVWHAVNRSLLWCLTDLGPGAARNEYCEGLLNLHETVPADWSAFVTHIIDELDVMKVREIPVALSAGRKSQVRRGSPGPVSTLAHSNYYAAFSDDGRWLAYDPGHWIQICRASDYGVVSRIRYEPSLDALKFSRDNAWLLLDGVPGKSRYRVPSGEPDPDYEPGAEWETRRFATRDGRIFVVRNAGVEPPWAGSPGTLEVYRSGPGGKERIGARALDDATMAGHVVLSPDGSMLALAGQGNIVRLYSVPDLEPRGEFTLPLPGGSDPSIRSMSFHPEGRALAVAFCEAFPAFIDLEAMKRFRPHAGHSREVGNVAFAAEDSLILTRARDRTVCAWDPKDLSFLSRVEAPAGYELAGMGGLQFSRILAVREGYDGDDWPDGRKAVVLDARTGERCFEVRLPEGVSTRDARWLTPKRVVFLAHDGSSVRTFDFEIGEFIGGFDCAEDNVYTGVPSEDGAWFFAPGPSGKGDREPSVRRIAMETGAGSVLPIPGNLRLTARLFGLVPGGESLFFADPGMLVLDRETLKTISAKPLPTIDHGCLAFSGDGRRYAVGAGSFEDQPEEVRRLCPEGTHSLVRVHDTVTGYTRFAFPTKAYRPKVALNADGTRLVFVEDDGRLVLVDL